MKKNIIVKSLGLKFSIHSNAVAEHTLKIGWQMSIGKKLEAYMLLIRFRNVNISWAFADTM
jgi:hypothetical protein